MSKTKLLEDLQDLIECDMVYVKGVCADGMETLLIVKDVWYDCEGDLVLDILKE